MKQYIYVLLPLLLIFFAITSCESVNKIDVPANFPLIIKRRIESFFLSNDFYPYVFSLEKSENKSNNVWKYKLNYKTDLKLRKINIKIFFDNWFSYYSKDKDILNRSIAKTLVRSFSLIGNIMGMKTDVIDLQITYNYSIKVVSNKRYYMVFMQKISVFTGGETNTVIYYVPIIYNRLTRNIMNIDDFFIGKNFETIKRKTLVSQVQVFFENKYIRREKRRFERAKRRDEDWTRVYDTVEEYERTQGNACLERRVLIKKGLASQSAFRNFIPLFEKDNIVALRFFFMPGEVASYSEGIQEFEIKVDCVKKKKQKQLCLLAL